MKLNEFYILEPDGIAKNTLSNGKDNFDNLWEPRKNLANTPNILRDYEQKEDQKKKKKHR